VQFERRTEASASARLLRPDTKPDDFSHFHHFKLFRENPCADIEGVDTIAGEHRGRIRADGALEENCAAEGLAFQERMAEIGGNFPAKLTVG